MKPRRLLILIALMTVAVLMMTLPGLWRQTAQVPGLMGRERVLLRVWITSSPGGAQAWLTKQLRTFEKQHPGVMTHLRIVSPEEITSPEAVLPDVILFMPGDLTAPETCLTPLTADSALREPLLRCGQHAGIQFGLPLCWGTWVMAIDGALEPGTAVTPAPTTLLGRPVATPAPSEAPGYPLTAAASAEVPLDCPGGAALLTLASLLPADARPPLPEDFAQRSASQVYAAFQARTCATAMLTTGQATAFTSLTSAGHGFPFRIMVPDTVVTDQVWLAGLTAESPPAAAELLSFLTAPEAQQSLASQGLHTVRDDLTLYAAGFAREVEMAGTFSLRAVNAFLPSAQVYAIAWQAFQGTLSLQDALPELL